MSDGGESQRCLKEKDRCAIKLHDGTKVDNYYQVLLHAYDIRNWDCQHGSSHPVTMKGTQMLEGFYPLHFRLMNFQFVCLIILVPASDLCPLADVTIEIRA